MTDSGLKSSGLKSSGTIKIGLIGVGSMGRYMADLTRRQSDQVNLNSVYDPDENAVEKCRSIGFEGRVCRSVGELLETDCDWVMISSWNTQHAEQTIAAFQNGKHVFCQKPLATNLPDCIAMRDAWKLSGKKFVIGFTLRYSPHYRRIKELVAEGAIGEIISLDFTETLHFSHGGFIMGDWRRLRENAGSHVLEKCCHDIDIINWLVASRVARVASFGGRNFFTESNESHVQRLGKDEKGAAAYLSWRGRTGENPFTTEKDIVDNQVVLLEYENHVRASFHMNSNSGIPERRLYICGSEGAIRSDVIKGTIELQRIGFETSREDHSTGVSGMHGEGDTVLARELVDVMLGNSLKRAGISEGLEAAVTCFAIDEALETGQTVQLDGYWSQLLEPAV